MIKNKIKFLFLGIFVVLFIFYILVFPNSSVEGVKKGLFYSSEIIIPSLFPFMVISTFIVKSSLSEKIGRFLKKPANFLFKLPGCTAATILVGLIGGYPCGAKGIKNLLDEKKITEEEAERMLCFTVGAGPAFVITAVGIKLLKNEKIGLILFFSQVIASVILGILVSRFKIKKTKKDNIYINKKDCSISSAFVSSCIDSVFGMINMCAFIVIFSFIVQIIEDNITNNFLVFMFLEVTNACVKSAQIRLSPEIIAFILGWAGLCVHFQIFSILGDLKFSKIKFIFFRFIQGILAAIFTYIGVLLIPDSQQVCNIILERNSIGLSSNTMASVCLILLSISFLLSIYPEVSCD